MEGYKIVTSRGCPYSCTYCANHQYAKLYRGLGKFYRRRSVENVIDELRAARQRYPLRAVRFFDDIFAFDKRWLEEFADAYRRAVGLPYFCFVHPSHCDRDTVRLLEASGCRTAFMGYATFSEETRSSVLRRSYSNRQVTDAIGYFRESKVYLIVDFILGLPRQSFEEVLSMARFFNDARPDALSGLFLRYYPGADITALAAAEGMLTGAQREEITRAGFRERIIIPKGVYAGLKRIQALMIILKYLPRTVARWMIDREFYRVFPPIDVNNFFVIIDSVLPKAAGKRRIHTDTISPLQYLHFYGSFMAAGAWANIRAALGGMRETLMRGPRTAFLIYKLGLRNLTLRKFLRMFSYLVRTQLLRRDCPGAVILGLTETCQCACVHCSVGFEPSRNRVTMDLESVKSVINALALCGVPKVNFFGGEPLLFGSGIFEAVSYASGKGMSVSIDTNGILLTEEVVRGLKKAGIDTINVSIDSADGLVHDALRGVPGTFEKAVKGIELCARERISCVVSTYASRRALETGDLEKIIRLARGLRAAAVKVLFPIMSGRWMHNQADILTPGEKKKVMRLLEPGFVYLESPLFSMRKGRKVCEALGRKMLYVSPRGDVQACYAVPVSFGNVRAEPVAGIIRRMWKSPFFNSIASECDCVMNNPLFRERYMSVIKEARELPVSYDSLPVS